MRAKSADISKINPVERVEEGNMPSNGARSGLVVS